MLWVIYAEDKPGSGELRRATRNDHLAYLEGKDVRVGGPLLDDEGVLRGSLLIVDLPDRAAVEAFVAGDPYQRAGLFERVAVHAWKKVVWSDPGDGD